MRFYLHATEDADPIDKDLLNSSGTIAGLLQQPRANTSNSLQASLDDLLGAVYSLILARHYGFADRPAGSPIDVEVVITRAKEVANGKVRIDGKWIAGFYFNNALFRLSAVYHRILKIITGHENKRWDVPKLLPEAQKLYQSAKNSDWKNSNIQVVHREVNTLKHTAGGVYTGRHVSLQQAVCALDELLDLIETCG